MRERLEDFKRLRLLALDHSCEVLDRRGRDAGFVEQLKPLGAATAREEFADEPGEGLPIGDTVWVGAESWFLRELGSAEHPAQGDE